MRKSRSETLFELNLKWIQIMFFAATRFMLFSDSRLSVSVRHSVRCGNGRKLKFQIVYNYFSINCHTLHTSLGPNRRRVFFCLPVLLELWKIFSRSISVFVFFFGVRKLIIYRSLICFFLIHSLLHLIRKLFTLFSQPQKLVFGLQSQRILRNLISQFFLCCCCLLALLQLFLRPSRNWP